MTIYIDISDLLTILEQRAHVSGIQRVQLEMFRYFYESGRKDVAFVISQNDPLHIHLIDHELFITIVRELDKRATPQDFFVDEISEIRKKTKKQTPINGDLLYISGAFWAKDDIFYTILQAKKSGSLVGFLCYDLIPQKYPEFTTREATLSFTANLGAMLGLSDFALTISKNVKDELDLYCASLGVALPTYAVALAHDMSQPLRPKATEASIRAQLSQHYVLFVSTLSPRKNHAYTLEIWKKLVGELPADKVPELIWVGQRGWMDDELIQQVEQVDYLGGKLKILHDISDTQLIELYRDAWFTMFPSFAEGWGLPVAESLMFGIPVICSNLTSLPEVGGEFAWYVDPYDITAGYNLVADLIQNPEKVRERAETIRSNFTPRRWEDVCMDTLAALQDAQSNQHHRPLPTLSDIKTNLVTAGCEPRSEVREHSPAYHAAARIGLFPRGWYSPEDWGRWMNGLKGTIELDLGVSGAPQQCLIYLHLKAFSGWRGKNLTLIPPNGGTPVPLKLVPGQEAAFVLQLPLSPGNNVIDLVVDRTDPIGTVDPRLLSIGILTCGFARVDDEATCAALHAEAQKVMQSVTRSPIRSALQRLRFWR